MSIYDEAEEIFVLVENVDGWRELVAAYRNLSEAIQSAKAMRALGRKVDVDCIILHI